MTRQFINVIKNVFVDKYGMRVIMTTHSPSTVALSPEDSIFEMSKTGVRIKSSSSKNNSISLLTSGLVYVGEGTKYLLVEDKDDVNFYTYIFQQSVEKGYITADIPLVFIPASTEVETGGCTLVKKRIEIFYKAGLTGIIQGLIDKDENNTDSQGVFVINRYSIENYLIDPLTLYAALMEQERHTQICDVGLEIDPAP